MIIIDHLSNWYIWLRIKIIIYQSVNWIIFDHRVDISINHTSTNDPYLSSSIGYMARWHNGLLPKRNTWRRLGSTGLSVYHGLFNAKLLVKLWCIPLFQGKQLDVPLVVFQQIQHPLGKRSPLRPLWPWLLDDMWTRSCFFPPCSAAAIGLAFFVEFLWQLEIIDDIQPYIWGVSGNYLVFGHWVSAAFLQ